MRYSYFNIGGAIHFDTITPFNIIALNVVINKHLWFNDIKLCVQEI